jgi:hypothetical protein
LKDLGEFQFLHGDSRQGVDEFDLDSSSFRSGSGVPASPDRHGSSSMKAVSLSVPPATPGTVALMKSGTGETLKSTPAGEYLTAALLDFNPDQYDGPAAVADGANKLLMLVWIFTLTRLIIKRGNSHCNTLTCIEILSGEKRGRENTKTMHPFAD